MEQGIIFNIQRYTINDGPGIRTEIFMKGCTLKCRWCSNPESQRTAIEPGVYSSKCISEDKCGLCITACRQQALLFAGGNIAGIDRSRCIGCMKCAAACPAEAVRAWGEKMSLGEVMAAIEKDRAFYEKSGGGVTVSGGEPLVQKDFTRSILKACQQAQPRKRQAEARKGRKACKGSRKACCKNSGHSREACGKSCRNAAV